MSIEILEDLTIQVCYEELDKVTKTDPITKEETTTEVLTAKIAYYPTIEAMAVKFPDGVTEATTKIAEYSQRKALNEWKANRQVAVDNIEVTYNGIVYQGDEISQGRMARATVAMDDTMSINWVAKDNSINMLTKAELVELLGMAGAIQSALWNEGRP